jgi:hypothetical protein
MQFLKQSTAVTLLIGPFLDSTNGVTPEIALTISQADVLLGKNGGAFAQKSEDTSCTKDASDNGWYTCPVDATDTDTLGRLTLAVNESGAVPIWHEFMVVPANVWDSLFGADKLQVDVTQVEGVDATDTIIGADSDTLETLSDQADAIKLKTDLITVGGLEVASPVASNETVEIVAGDDYASTDSTAITFTVAGYAGPSLTSATVRMAIVNQDEYDAGSAAADLTITGTGAVDAGTATFTFELTAAQTDNLNTQPPQDSYSYVYQVTVETSGGHLYTVAIGSMNVRGNVTNG